MKKIFLTFLCLLLAMAIDAQELKKVAIKTATATSNSTSEGAKMAIDGDYSTFWHSPWNGQTTSFPTNFTITLEEECLVDVARYVPRQDNQNGSWGKVEVLYRNTESGTQYISLGTFNLNQSGKTYDFPIGKVCKYLRFRIYDGKGGWATAAEIEVGSYDNTKLEAFQSYFQDNLFTTLKPEVTSSEGIEDADVKALVDNLLTDQEYKNFRVGEYEPYRTLASLQQELKTKSTYNPWENPTGIYVKRGNSFYVMVEGIENETVGLSIKNWGLSEEGSSYSLRNGLNHITATTEGNVFVDYFTDNYKTAPNVRMHFINAPVRGYWDQETMTNADWVKMLSKLSAKDSSIIIVRSEHAQVAFPVVAWKQHCPTNVDSLMTLYQQVEWAERDIMGLEKYGRQTKNRQLYFATTYGFMAAGGNGAYCNISSLGAIMAPDSKRFDFWGVGHEWGHNNQISPGFHWSGCGETTNNIYASWAQIHFTGTRSNLRLEDEWSGIDEYSGMRGGRMQTYFEEALRKGVQWQLQDGPDYHGTTPNTITVMGYDYNGNSTGMVTTTSRNYDHFVKLVPFWQLNLWGTLAGKCPDIIPMVIEGIRTNNNYGSTYNTNGKQQVNWMKLACDSAKIDLLPFFEKAGMLKPINAYIEDYGAGWNKINQSMINDLKKHVASKGYPAFTEEINYINGHNYHIYRDNLKLSVPATLGSGCTYNAGKVKVSHSSVKNAVAFETYNANGELVRITMYGLGSDDAHSFTMVLYPTSTDEAEAAAYIMAVGYDGTRKKIYEKNNLIKSIANKFYTITSSGRGNCLSCGSSSSIAQNGTITWSLTRASKSASSADIVWFAEEKDGLTYLYNPQSQSYFGGSSSSMTTKLYTKSSAIAWKAECIDDAANKYVFGDGSGQYINAYSASETGLYGGGAGDANNIWILEEVKTINVSTSSTHGTVFACYPFALELTDEIDAYVVSGVEKLPYGDDNTVYTYAVLDRIDGNIVPANMPVIFIGSKKAHKLKLVANDNTPHKTPNLLKGTALKLTGMTMGSVMNTLSASTEAGTTAQVKVSTTATTLAKNKSCLLYSDFSNVSPVFLATRDFITGIEDVEVPQDNEGKVFYELNGARATKLQSGRVYVTSDGKRILVK